MLHQIKKVEYLDHYRLKLQFNNRQTKIVDLEHVLKKAKNMLLPLKDLGYFKKVKTDGVTLFWPNGVDFCPDTLFEISQDIHKSKKRPFKESASRVLKNSRASIAAKSKSQARY